MNDTTRPDSVSNVPWQTSKQRVPETGDSMLPDSDKAAAKVDHAANTAHATIDRLADSAAPAARHLADKASAAEQALHDGTDRLRDTRDAWVEGVRTTVRDNPVTSVTAAFALGAAIARLAR